MHLPSRNKPNLDTVLQQHTVCLKKRRAPSHRCQHLNSLYSWQKETGTSRDSFVWPALGIYSGMTCHKDAVFFHWLQGAEVVSPVGSALLCRSLKLGEVNPTLSMSSYSPIQSHVQVQQMPKKFWHLKQKGVINESDQDSFPKICTDSGEFLQQLSKAHRIG